jgi:uncharacterized protein (DUF1330 family)
MSGLFIARVDVSDPEKYGQYQELALQAISKYGGEFLTRGGAVTTMEGPEEDRRVVVVRFDSADRAREFYNSLEYQAAYQKRIGAADFNAIVVEGA